MSALNQIGFAGASIRDLPGPRGDRWSGNLAAYEADRLGFLLRQHAEFGGLVRFDERTTIVNDPRLATEILLDRNQSFAIRENFLGERLSPGEMAETLQLRPALNPGMRRAKAVGVAPGVASLLACELRADPGGGANPLFMLERVCAQSIADLYFGSDAPSVVNRVRSLLLVLDEYFGNPFGLPASWPTPGRLRARKRHRELQSVLVPLLRDRMLRSSGRDGDLATALVQALCRREDAPSVERMGQLVIGSLLAAQRVPAAAAAWMLWEVAQDRPLQRQLRPEAGRYSDVALSGAVPIPNGYPLAMAVVLESLRLHPPTWLLHRSLIRDDRIGRFDAPRGHNVLISPYVIHRDGARFENADCFRIDRWRNHQAPPTGFIPFGRGLRGCPGSEIGVAMLVAILLTAVGGWDIAPGDGEVVANPRSTLLPSGLELVFEAR